MGKKIVRYTRRIRRLGSVHSYEELFWFLDINYEVGEHKPEIWIWGIDEKGQEKVLEMTLKEPTPQKGVEKATKYVRQYIAGLRLKKVPYRDLIIWKTLTKPVEEYEVKAPHVEAARILLKEGWELSMGDKIGYVITTGSGKLYEKAKPYFLTNYDKVDIEYYVTNQVLPAASRILAMFDISTDKLLP